MKNRLLLTLTAILMMAAFSHTALASTMAVRWMKPATENAKCGIQEQVLNKAVNELNRNLHGKDIKVQFGYVTFTQEKPTGDAASSVGLWINGKPFEYWLHAQSTGNEDCVELMVDGQKYNTIPAELIVKAGMTAAEVMSTPATKEKPKQALAQ
jgi:hypothetical protein